MRITLDNIRQIDIRAMLRERHGITDEAHAREALAIAGHEAAHVAAGVACRAPITGVFLNLRPKLRRRLSIVHAPIFDPYERVAFVTLAGAAWERVYADGTEKCGWGDSESGRRQAGTRWPAVLDAADEFVERYADVIFWSGVFLLATMPKLSGSIADRNITHLVRWLRPQLSLPSLPVVSDDDRLTYAHNQPKTPDLPPPSRPLRKFTPPIELEPPTAQPAPTGEAVDSDFELIQMLRELEAEMYPARFAHRSV